LPAPPFFHKASLARVPLRLLASSLLAMGGDGPPRGGTRGGRDQFNWESVKSDKDREFYLGASVKATVGRWQAGRDLLWYTHDAGRPGAASAAALELQAVKAEEQRLMAEALGLQPAESRRGASGLGESEVKQLLRRGAGADGLEDGPSETARVKGLGYSSLAADAAAAPQAGEQFVGREVLAALQAAAPVAETAAPVQRVRHDSASESDSGTSEEGKGERKAARRARKEARAFRRAERRARKEARRERRSRSRSRDGRRRSRSRSREQDRRQEHRRQH